MNLNDVGRFFDWDIVIIT